MHAHPFQSSAGDHQFVGVMPTCTIDLHDDEVLRERLADMLKEEIHHGGIDAISSACAGYVGFPFQKWLILLFISAVSRSCGMNI